MTIEAWRPLTEALDRWADRGKVAEFWLRDDDATMPTEALDRLLDLTEAHSVPVTLAVVPEPTGGALATRIERAKAVTVVAHGWAHKNHAGWGDKKQELGAHRPAPDVLAELHRGFRKLEALHGPHFVPMLVPPWNRIDAALLPLLPQIGFQALSVFGAERTGPVRMINSHVDLIDWRGTGGGRDPALLITEVIARLEVMQTAGGCAGFLTHHLVNDRAAWQFIEGFLHVTSGHSACRWARLDDAAQLA